MLVQNVVNQVARHLPSVFLGNHVQEEWKVVGGLRSGGVVGCLGIKEFLVKSVFDHHGPLRASLGVAFFPMPAAILESTRVVIVVEV